MKSKSTENIRTSDMNSHRLKSVKCWPSEVKVVVQTVSSEQTLWGVYLTFYKSVVYSVCNYVEMEIK